MTANKIVIATRGSKLALWQAHHVRDRIREVDPSIDVEVLVIKTKGDKILDVPLAEIGGKGLFVKEIEQAIIDGRAHLAVHSAKDVPADSELPGELALVAFSEREDPRDALVSASGKGLDELAKGAVIGTSSLRRRALIAARRPDLAIEMLRGNVPTRISRLDEGRFDAIVLAAAGLARLGLADRITQYLAPEVMLPASGQGTLAIEARRDDDSTIDIARRAIHHERDSRRTLAERAFLAELEGGCQTPMAAHAYYDGDAATSDRLIVDGFVARPDGRDLLRASRTGSADDAVDLGRDVARELLDRGAGDILAELSEHR